MDAKLGRLERVELRQAWRSESMDFTPWLARAENLELLAIAMGLDADSLELQGQEQAVGPFRADILCRNTEDNSLVLIENQLERTDHTHLGQLITYAAGLKAVTLVWIAERFTEEHRAALDWLNEITHESFHIFGFEIEVWRIGNSPLAPKFNVVVQANDWARQIREATKSAKLTAVGQMQLEYWTSFGAYIDANRVGLRQPKPYPTNWMSWGLGRAGVQITGFANRQHIAVGLQVNNWEHPTWFTKLHAHKERVEAALGFELRWDEKPGNKHALIICTCDLDMYDPSNWPDASKWMSERLVRMRNVFLPLVKALDDETLVVDVEFEDTEAGS